MSLYRILVPANYNDGSAVGPAMLREAVDEAVRLAGGVTVGAEASGYWFSGGRLFADRMLPFELSCPRPQALAFAAWVAEAFEQESVFVADIASDVFFVPRRGR